MNENDATGKGNPVMPRIVKDLKYVATTFEKKVAMEIANASHDSKSGKVDIINVHQNTISFLHALIDNYPYCNVVPALGLTTRDISRIDTEVLLGYSGAVSSEYGSTWRNVHDISSAFHKSNPAELEKHGLVFELPSPTVIRNSRVESSSSPEPEKKNLSLLEPVKKSGLQISADEEGINIFADRDFPKSVYFYAVLGLSSGIVSGFAISNTAGIIVSVVGCALTLSLFKTFSWLNPKKTKDKKVVKGQTLSVVVHDNLKNDIIDCANLYANINNGRILVAFREIKSNLDKIARGEEKSKLGANDRVVLRIVIKSQLIPTAQHYQDITEMGNEEEKQRAEDLSIKQLSAISLAVEEIRKKVMQNSFDSISGHSLYLESLYSHKNQLDMNKS